MPNANRTKWIRHACTEYLKAKHAAVYEKIYEAALKKFPLLTRTRPADPDLQKLIESIRE